MNTRKYEVKGSKQKEEHDIYVQERNLIPNVVIADKTDTVWEIVGKKIHWRNQSVVMTKHKQTLVIAIDKQTQIQILILFTIVRPPPHLK